jgi:hypothetical protein
LADISKFILCFTCLALTLDCDFCSVPLNWYSMLHMSGFVSLDCDFCSVPLKIYLYPPIHVVPMHVTDFSVVNAHVDELLSARIWKHRLCATFSANVNINYRLPIKVCYHVWLCLSGLWFLFCSPYWYSIFLMSSFDYLDSDFFSVPSN